MADLDTGKRIGPIAGTGADALLYTCAAAGGFWLRHIRVVNTTTTAQTFRLSIGTTAAGTALYWDEQVSPSPEPAYIATVAEFIANTETIRWNAPTTLTITISGVESA